MWLLHYEGCIVCWPKLVCFPVIWSAGNLWSCWKENSSHIKSGDDGWAQIVVPTGIGFCDVNYYEGQFVVVSFEGLVFTINVSCDSISKPHIRKVLEQASLVHLTLSNRPGEIYCSLGSLNSLIFCYIGWLWALRFSSWYVLMEIDQKGLRRLKVLEIMLCFCVKLNPCASALDFPEYWAFILSL